MAMASAAGDVDRISALPDDLLHLMLGFVLDAKSVVRTTALSRRWPRVWIHARKLALLGPGPDVDPGNFVDSVLAQRGDADIESLIISMPRSSLDYAPQAKINGWLRYATQRVVKSFRLDLRNSRHSRFRPWQHFPLRVEGPAVSLPDRGRMASMEMFLPSCYSFRLPVAASAKYEALTELTLYNASFFDDAGGGRTLGDFVSSSSCCPRLRKLDISSIKGLAQLAIRSEALESFKLRSTKDLRLLDVAAPNLRVLELKDCFGDESNDKTRIASSRLQEVEIRHRSRDRRPDLVIHDLKTVRRLRLDLNMHGQYYVRTTDVGFWLLEKCPGVEHVRVSLGHQPSLIGGVIEGNAVIADSTSEGAAPFASVRSIDMVACAFCVERYAWTDHRSISLELLEDVEIIGFRGADEDIDLVRLLFASSKNSIKSMTLDNITKTCGPGTVSLKRVMAEDGNGTETIDQKLMNIPTADSGRWDFGDTVYTWRSYAT